MAEPFTTVGVIGAAFDWAIGRIGELGVNALKARLADGASKQELAQIAARSVEEAAMVAPGLAELLRSEAYINDVLTTGILDILRDPGAGLDSAQLARRFLERFVTPYIERPEVDETVRRVFKAEPEQVQVPSPSPPFGAPGRRCRSSISSRQTAGSHCCSTVGTNWISTARAG
jgi:hypothetical protein